MPRVSSHIKETIATRAFEHALHPSLVTQPTRQGADYGIDSWVTVFDDEGEIDRTFAVQVKYVDPKDVTHTARDQEQAALRDWHVLTRYAHPGPCLARVPLPKRRLREYLDRAKTPAEVLLVAANDEDFFYLWLSDLDEYLLGWMPGVLQGSGSLTVLLNSVRARWRGDPPMLFLRELSLESGKWFDGTNRPGTIDSIANIAASAYLQSADPRNRRHRSLDVEGLWRFVQEKGRTQPEIPLLFGHQFALLSSTDAMARWAVTALRGDPNVFATPLACSILAGSPNADLVGEGVDALHSFEPHARYYVAHVRRLVGYTGDYPYLDHELTCATAELLARAVERHRLERAQKMLVDAFGEFPQGIAVPNFYARNLQHLARRKLLLRGKSLDLLRHWCGFGPRAGGGAIADSIAATDQRWFDEYQEGR